MSYKDRKKQTKKDRCPYCGSHKGLGETTFKERWHDDNGVWWVKKDRCLTCKNTPDCGQVVEELETTTEKE